MAPVAYWEASTSRMNCRSWSGGTRTGSDVTMSRRVTRAVVQAGVQSKVVVFFRRFVSGFAISTKHGMKGHWNPRIPSVLLTSLMDFRVVGQSLIPVILLGSMLISPCPSHTPRKSTSGCSNTHFEGFRKYECSWKIWSRRWFICLWSTSSPSAVATRQSFM